MFSPAALLQFETMLLSRALKPSLGAALFLALCSLTATAAAAPDGAALFARNCSACHGAAGRGGVGVPLALPSFLTSVPDDYLFKTIRHGRPGRVMPSFASLSDAQVNAIVRHIRGWMPAGSHVDIPATPVKGDPAHGKALYRANCATCHGEHGGGGHGTGVTFSRPRDLPIIPPALNNPGFLASASDQMIKATLMHGREGTPMVSFLKRGLTEKDIDDVVAYVRSFQKNPIHWKPANNDNPVLEADSPYTLEETVEAVKRAAVGRNFRLIRIQRLEDGFFPKKAQNQRQVIVYFCNFSFINKALALDPRVGLFMPCRVTVVQDADGVHVMSINPKYLSRLYNNAELDDSCSRMYDVYEGILEEATL
jgi:cytochrome c oxidase cbb3-type subunit 3